MELLVRRADEAAVRFRVIVEIRPVHPQVGGVEQRTPGCSATPKLGESYDNAMAESIIGLYKSELITARGPWRNVDDVELATLSWVHWWNTTRLHSAIGYLPADQFEAVHYAQQQPANPAGIH